MTSNEHKATLNGPESTNLSAWALELLLCEQAPVLTYNNFLNSWSEKTQIKILQSKISYQFRHIENLFQALTHSSFANQFISLELKSNERLEYLGDGLIDGHVSIALFERFPQLNEGDLSKLRGSIVNEDEFSKLAMILHLDDLLLVGKGEFMAGGPKKKSLLGDCFESLMGSIYVDGGWSEFERVFEYVVEAAKEYNIHFYDSSRLESFDAKSKLQEEILKEFKILPEYKIKEDKNGLFSVELFVKGISLGQNKDSSKKKATKILAQNILTTNWKEKIRKEV